MMEYWKGGMLGEERMEHGAKEIISNFEIQIANLGKSREFWKKEIKIEFLFTTGYSNNTIRMNVVIERA
jgi:hypothetical protein